MDDNIRQVIGSAIESRMSQVEAIAAHRKTVAELMSPSSGHVWNGDQFMALVYALAAMEAQSIEWTERVEKMRGWLREGCVFTGMPEKPRPSGRGGC